MTVATGVEIRVHGVGKHDPSEILSAPIREAGDSRVGLYRPPEISPKVRAFAWSRLTRRWTGVYRYLLVPFSLVNVAGFMGDPDEDKANPRTALMFFLTVAGATITVSYLVWLIVLAVDLPLLFGAPAGWRTVGLVIALAAILLPLVIHAVGSYRTVGGDASDYQHELDENELGPLATHGFWKREGPGDMALFHIAGVVMFFALVTLVDSAWSGGELLGTLVIQQGVLFVALSSGLLVFARHTNVIPYRNAIFVVGLGIALTHLLFGALTEGIASLGGRLAGRVSPVGEPVVLRPEYLWRWIPLAMFLILSWWGTLQFLSIRKFRTGKRRRGEADQVAWDYGVETRYPPWPRWVLNVARSRERRWLADVSAGLLVRPLALLVGTLVVVTLGNLVFSPAPPFASQSVVVLSTELFSRFRPGALVVLYGLAATTLLGLYWLARSRGLQDRAALIFDVLGFWPRRHHPLAPPPYSASVVTQLARDLSSFSPEAPVVLVGHSQGSVISYAALLRSTDAVRKRVTFITCGSPLASLYEQVFPSYFRRDDFKRLADSLANVPGAGGPGWINLFRDTDPLGRPLFGYKDEKDVLLLEPRPELGLKVHSDYWSEPAVRDVVDRVLS